MLSLRCIVYLLEKRLNRLAVLFSGIAPAILEAQTWSHFGMEKKRRDKPLSPLPKCTSCKMHLDPIFSTVNSSKDRFDKCQLCLFVDLKVTDFYSEYKKGV